ISPMKARIATTSEPARPRKKIDSRIRTSRCNIVDATSHDEARAHKEVIKSPERKRFGGAGTQAREHLGQGPGQKESKEQLQWWQQSLLLLAFHISSVLVEDHAGDVAFA